ncbi:hypothetical protein [Mucilaginibacter sp. HD30]
MRNLILMLPILTTIFISNILKAQNLPNQQTESIALQPGFKIDGLAKEWNDKFQAYNKRTETNYILANNSQYIYLAIQAVDPLIIKKIIGGGMSFTINTSGSREDLSPYIITFPVIPNDRQLSIFPSLEDMKAHSNEKVHATRSFT